MGDGDLLRFALKVLLSAALFFARLTFALAGTFGGAIKPLGWMGGELFAAQGRVVLSSVFALADLAVVVAMGDGSRSFFGDGVLSLFGGIDVCASAASAALRKNVAMVTPTV